MKRLLALLFGALLATGALAGGYVGDYAPGDIIDCKFGTVRPSTGASFTLAGTPAVSAYKDNSTTQSTTGVTLTADFDSVTGANHVRVTTASDGSFYSSGSFFDLMITTGTVDSVSVVGQPVCSFSLRKVNLGQGAAGTLSGTHTTTTADLGTNAPGATSQLAGMGLNIPSKQFSAVITSYNSGTGVVTFAPATALTLADGDFWYLWPLPSTVLATDSIDSNVLAASGTAEIGTANWASASRTLTAATNITSTGGTIAITGGRSDASVGAYQSGLAPLQPTVAGRFLNVSAGGHAGINWADIGSPTTSNNLSGTTISTSQIIASVTGAVGSVSGLNPADVAAILAAVDTEVAAIKAKTDQMTFGVVNELNVNVESQNAAAMCGTGDVGTPWKGCP